MFKSNDPCLAKVGDDEPIFVLRAQDKFAATLIRLWADLVEIHHVSRRGGASEAVLDKVQEARSLAARMERWPKRKWPD